jgi:pimeloyl-ACP methyl ester carboxylesterase
MYFRLYRGADERLTPLLCLPGFWRNSRDHETLAPHVARQRTVIALEMAVQKPERVAAIVLNDVGPEKPPTAVSRMSKGYATADEYSFDEAVDRVKTQNETTFHGLRSEDWERLMLRAYKQTATGRYTRDFDQVTNEASVALLTARPTWWKELKSAANIPMALLRGEFSDYLSEDIVARMKQVVPGLIVANVKGRGHPPLLDEPEVYEALEAVFARVDANA